MSFTEKQIEALNNLYKTEPLLKAFNLNVSEFGLGDLIRLIESEENKRYSFMIS